MSRRRYISSDISTDPKTAELAEYGTLPLLLFTWAIPHMDDWGRMVGDARQFKLLVCPALDVSTKEVDEALDQIASVKLWVRYEVDGKQYIGIPEDSWFKHQSYINKAKREDDRGSNYPRMPHFTAKHRTSPQITEEHRELPQNTVSPSPSPSFTTTTTSEEQETVMDVHTKVFGTFSMNGLMSDFVMNLKSEGYTDVFICELMYEAGESSGGKPNLNYMKKIFERWKQDGIYTRVEAKRRKDGNKRPDGKPYRPTNKAIPNLELVEITPERDEQFDAIYAKRGITDSAS